MMENPSRLVVLLEQEYEVAVKGGSQDIRATLFAGLNWKTAYWVNCALKWIEQGAKLDQEIVDRLVEISKNKKAYPQSTRHQAFKYVKRWQREQST